MRTDVSVSPAGSSGTCHSSTLHHVPTSFPWSNFPPRHEEERVGWTYSGTHKPVYPAEVLCPLAPSSPDQALLAPALPGKRGTELFPLPPPIQVYSRVEFPTSSSHAGRKVSHPLVPHWGRPGSLPLPPPRSVPPGQGWDPWLHPLSIVLPSCLCACGCACTCAPLQGAEVRLVIEAGCCVCWGRGRSFGLVLPLSTLPLGQCIVGAFPTPTLPAQLLLLPCTPGWWAKLLVRTGSSGRWEGLPSSPREPPPPQTGLLKVPGWAPLRG